MFCVDLSADAIFHSYALNLAGECVLWLLVFYHGSVWDGYLFYILKLGVGLVGVRSSV